MNSVKQRNPGNPNERNRILSPFAHRAVRSTSSPLGWESDLDGQVHEELKARKGRNECDVGQNKHRKTLGEKGIKREMHVNRWLLSSIVQPCPVPDHCSLSQLLVKLHLYLISRVRGTSALRDCAWQRTLQQPRCCHESRGAWGAASRGQSPRVLLAPVSVHHLWQTPRQRSQHVAREPRLGAAMALGRVLERPEGLRSGCWRGRTPGDWPLLRSPSWTCCQRPSAGL